MTRAGTIKVNIFTNEMRLAVVAEDSSSAALPRVERVLFHVRNVEQAPSDAVESTPRTARRRRRDGDVDNKQPSRSEFEVLKPGNLALNQRTSLKRWSDIYAQNYLLNTSIRCRATWF